jgi:hypothetical protein
VGHGHAHLLVNLLICDSVVIGDTAARREAQFLEDFPWLAKREILAAAQAACQVTDNVGIRACVARWIHRLPDMNDAPFRIGGDALLFLLQAAGQHHVRMRRGFRKEEIDDAEKLQALQCFTCEIGIGQGDQRVKADGEQPFDFAAVNGVHNLDCRITRSRQFVR